MVFSQHTDMTLTSEQYLYQKVHFEAHFFVEDLCYQTAENNGTTEINIQF